MRTTQDTKAKATAETKAEPKDQTQAARILQGGTAENQASPDLDGFWVRIGRCRNVLGSTHQCSFCGRRRSIRYCSGSHVVLDKSGILMKNGFSQPFRLKV